MRASGILLPVSSLPSPYGIGAFSKEAYRFIDFLVKAGQKNWQILPLGPTGYGDSPYQSFSTFAGNPYFIDPEALISEGVLQQSEIEEYDFGDNPQYVDYEKIYKSRFKLLRKAFDRSYIAEDAEFLRYREENSFWLDDYSLYMAVKDHFEGISWIEWDEDIRLRKTEAMNKYKEKLETEILFYQYMQFLFSSQWAKLKRYANDRGIRIIGDIPIYVAFDSSDSWAHTELFQFDENRKPIAVAGCPPDGFSATGQLWGNPLYNWEYHKQTGYEWWIKRIDYCFKLYDVLRVDHFRGFDEYYAIPFGNETAQYGQWMKGPGLEFFRTLNQKTGRTGYYCRRFRIPDTVSSAAC